MVHSVEELLNFVEPRFHDDFQQFIETGYASPNFLAYLDSDKQCQQAVEMAFDDQTQAFHEAFDLIRWELDHSVASARHSLEVSG